MNNNEIDAILLWDTMKMQIRSSSLNYARRKKAKMKSLESKLESEILSLQKELEENNVSEDEKVQICSEIDVKILQREEISKYKTQRAMLRSKSRWHNEGENNTKYFLNLEKRHFSKKKNKKNIKQFTSANNNVVNTDSEILKEAKSSYQNLCSSTNTQSDTKEGNMFFPDGNTLILNEQEQKQCEGFLTASECLESLKSMESNKSPRRDGLPAEFWNLSGYLGKSILYRYQLHLCSKQRMVFGLLQLRSRCERGILAVPIFSYFMR